MRELKFRAWDNEYKYMNYKVLVGNVWDTDTKYTAHAMRIEPKYVSYKKESGWCHFDEHSNIELMQYTGLKDKNGVEIYEGDILKYPYVRSSSINYSIEIGVIEWSDEYCGFIIDEVQNIGGFCGIELKHMKELEVIGNIYEHAHLLDNN